MEATISLSVYYEQQLTYIVMHGKHPATIDVYSRALPRIMYPLDKSPYTLAEKILNNIFGNSVGTRHISLSFISTELYSKSEPVFSILLLHNDDRTLNLISYFMNI